MGIVILCPYFVSVPGSTLHGSGTLPNIGSHLGRISAGSVSVPTSAESSAAKFEEKHLGKKNTS